ncbi:SDR family NAD(P)-dependent oxidoreductase [Nesterenkonia halotolerans]|uniref:NAD(P)-dependent dehydrogenase (Short-subunit alcohol dehydrogenase family) n=1 Tax=Nesterenkonia halotolerans TaxID=225325 RepID=A0ABR9J9A7_9MICC|nr:SDR family NAD(P)-dependent oxidoreductase [Nesterenkonia halotolerans]MBE1515582.1 NAD(P)-dependent dehydrogenase (short-subunit alcohol dehydrogenase family) [Nesterenkonia halotolerans]
MARFTSPFSATSTAAEVLEGVDLHGRSAVVTGASSGIGVETARALAGAGAHVVLAVRDVAAGRRAAEDVAHTHPGASLEVGSLDLADLASVERFTESWSSPLHLLVNNAGIMMTPELRTARGWELQFATNHLGHFALALRLHPAMVEAGGARIVSVSSSGHGMSDIVYEDLFFERRPYDPGQAYGQSKTANVLFAVEASRRWAAEGITANAVMPGGIWTNLQRHWDPQALADTKAYVADAGIAMKTPAQGAATSVLAAASPLLTGVGGLYLEDCEEAEAVPEIVNGTHGVRPYALDSENATRLWDVSLELLRST